LCRTI
jgi:hypothetical protein